MESLRRSLGIFLALVPFASAWAPPVPWAATQPLKNLTGLQTPKNWEVLAPFQRNFTVAEVELPSFYDWRFYANGFPPVNRQVNSDCWAQGTVGVLEGLLKIHLQDSVRQSVQQVISCSNSGSAANGGYFAHKYHQTFGAVSNEEFPYVGRDVRCKSGLQPSHSLAQWGYVGQQGRKPTTLQMKQAMMEHGPLGVTITANNAMQNFRGNGVFKGCSNGGTNHIVVLVGWDDTEGTDGVWIMRNSWGTSHGENGYAKIPYGCSRIGEQTTWADLKTPEMGTVRAIDVLAERATGKRIVDPAARMAATEEFVRTGGLRTYLARNAKSKRTLRAKSDALPKKQTTF